MKINPKVVSDRFDDEVVVVNLDNGFYYSFKNAALEIWSELNGNTSQKNILASFGELTDEQTTKLNAFFEFLKTEILVVDTEDVPSVITNNKFVYSNPEYLKFDDMADLIMIDPIHEVDENKGWPHKSS